MGRNTPTLIKPRDTSSYYNSAAVANKL